MKKRKDGRYRLKITVPNAKPIYVYGRTQAEVKEKQKRVQAEIGKGAYYYGDNTLMQDWAVIWWNTFKKDKTGSKSQAIYTFRFSPLHFIVVFYLHDLIAFTKNPPTVNFFLFVRRRRIHNFLKFPV